MQYCRFLCVDIRSITIASILLIFVIGFTSNVYGQVVDPITVSTDKSFYYDGETIVVFGKVSENLFGYAISIEIFAPNGERVAVEQVLPEADKTYSTKFSAGGQLMNETGPGTYTVVVLYATETRTAKTTFQYIYSNPDTGTIIFKDPKITDSNGNYVYSIRTGTQYDLTSTIINQKNVNLESFTYQTLASIQGNSDPLINAWIAGSLMPGESYSPSLSWIPEEPGTYDIFLHLFDNLELQNKLAPSLSLSVIVKEPIQQGIGIDAYTSKSVYKDGDVVFVSGSLKNFNYKIHSNTAVTYRVLDPHGDLVTASQAIPNSDGVYSFNFVTGGSYYKESGNYTIQLFFRLSESDISLPYISENIIPGDITPPKFLQPQKIEVHAEARDGVTKVTYEVLAIDDTDQIIRPICKPSSGSFFGIGETIIKCTAKDSAGNFATSISFTVKVSPPGISIPEWVKNVAAFWCEDKIDDDSFVEGIQYLIDNGIIVVPATTESDSISQEIPQWVKNNACWWSLGSITDGDFAYGIEYLVKQGIIQV